MLSEANTWSFGLFDDNACGGVQSDAVSAIDLPSDLTDHTILMGIIRKEDEKQNPVLSTMAGKSVSVFGDNGQASCCEIVNLVDRSAKRRMLDVSMHEDF